MIGIIDYGMGNLFSVFHAVQAAGFEAHLCRSPEELAAVDRLILPGVGAFRDAMRNLTQTGFAPALEEVVRRQGKPILGICLGMQAMARRSFEGGEFGGLGWFEADVVRLNPADRALRVPHIGWNQVRHLQDCPLFMGLPAAPDFYFVHSYHLQCDHAPDVVATCDYGGPVAAAVARGHIFATQFHPEKSQEYGLRVLANFLRWHF